MTPEETTALQSAAWSQQWRAEDEILLRARAKARDAGCQPVEPAVGALLQVLAAATAATAVVEVGTGTGVSGTWILRGMASNGVLTTIDYEAENQRIARTTFSEAAVPPQRTRVITGKARDVLQRLTPAAYDMVFIDADEREHPELLQCALPLLRSRGLLVVDDALSGGKVPDPARRDAATVAVRGMLTAVAENVGLIPVVLPVGPGLLIAVAP
ncbi:MAG: O-methyltransferase [Actinobacteria bacterium]|nr:O-methyltransferase [Actinomycetota bacterium]